MLLLGNFDVEKVNADALRQGQDKRIEISRL
jgi:hypothetical protein